MANTKVYVNTDSSGGTNGSTNASGVAFPSLDAALTYAAANKVAGDIWTIICSAPSGVMPVGTSFDVSGISTNSTGYLHIRPNRGNEGGTVADQRHNGVWSTSKFRYGYTNNFVVNQTYVRITGLQIFPKGTGNLPPNGPYLTADNCKLERCIIYADPAYAGDGSSGNNIGIRGSGSTSNTVIANCIVIGFNIATAYTPGLGVLNVSAQHYNLTVVNCRRGYYFSNVHTIKNSLGYGSTTNDWDGGGWNYATVDYCASEDNTVPGTHKQSSATFTFTNAAGIDFTLSNSDTGAKGLGLDLGSSLDWNDVDGNLNGPRVAINEVTRTTTWSIGASEPVAGGGGGGATSFAAGRYSFRFAFGKGASTGGGPGNPALNVSGYWTEAPSFAGRPVNHVAHTGNKDTSGAALSAAIASEISLDRNAVITLDPNVEYCVADSTDYGLKLGPKTSTKKICICTAGINTGDVGMPAFGTQVTPADASKFALITHKQTAGAAGATIWIPDGSHYWELCGLRIAPEITHRFGIVVLGGNSDPGDYGGTWADHTSHILLDRILIDPSTTNNGVDTVTSGHHFQNNSGAIIANGRQVYLSGCYVEVSDIVGQGDYKCFEVIHGTYITIDDTELFRGGETFFIGGGGVGDVYNLGVTFPHHVRFRRCWLHKDHDQMKVEKWLSKNGGETKGSTDVSFEGCILETGQTIAGDTGQNYMLTGVCYPEADNSDPKFFHYENWQYINCVLRGGYSLHLNRGYYSDPGHADYADQIPSGRIKFVNSFIGAFSLAGDGGWLLFLSNWYGLTLDHCTVDVRTPAGDERYNSPFQLEQAAGPAPPAVPFTEFVMRDSIIAGAYRSLITNNSQPDSVYRYGHTFYTTYLEPNGAILENNLWCSKTASDDVGTYSFVPEFDVNDADPNWRYRNDNWPTTVFTDATAADGTGDYTVKVGSPYKAGGARDATDGKDLGVDWSQMQTAMGALVWSKV